jgi:protein involved in polysaccharide export with SLBB domain
MRRFLLSSALTALAFIAPGAPQNAWGSDGFLPLRIPHWSDFQQASLEEQAGEAESITPRRQEPTKSQQHKTQPTNLPPLKPGEYQDLLMAMDPALSNAARASALEDMYSHRVIDEVKQFGYDLFGSKAMTGTKDSANTTLPAGAVQDNFILNIGDKLNIMFRGQRNQQGIYGITSEGLLIVEDMPPIPAAGRSIAQLREALETSAADFHNTSVFVSLESVQQVNVLIVGHVANPGRKNLTVFHTALDALMQSGGIQKTGSLRQIKLIRNGRTQVIDLYSLLLHGSAGMDLSLRDGDRIIVPTIGPTLAVTGEVKRPGIYEILPSLQGMKHRPEEASEELSLQEALDMAGGLLSPGNNRFMKLGMKNDGREIVEDLKAPFTPALGDGSILMVSRADEMRSKTVELSGHTRQPGIHALSTTPTLSALFKDATVFGPDIYPLIGVIERTDSGTLSKQMLDFPPQLVLSGQFDRKLQDGDSVILFSRAEIKNLQKTTPTEPVEMGSMEDSDTQPISPALKAFLKERAVYVRGAVRDPGLWPVAEGATLKTLVAATGGFNIEANTANIEITSNAQGEGYQEGERSGTARKTINYQETDPSTIALIPGDAVRVNQKFRKTGGQSVMIIGEVNHPGKYDLLPGDTLSKLMERAGGITDQAYPDGTIFSRDTERRAEEARFRAAAQELERAIAAARDKKDNPPDSNQIALVRELATELRNVEAVGRITVQGDPTVLKAQPEQDLLLESGDRIYIPSRPMTVRVHGEVMSPASLQFRANKTPNTYIDEAGGMTYYADDDRAFVLYPDGSAQPLLVSAWNHKATFIPPGSTIVVPRDPKPFDFIETAKDFSQILSNLAITGIFLSDIKDDD